MLDEDLSEYLKDFSDFDSEDSDYEEESDDDSVLSGSVDNEIEDVADLEDVINDQFLNELCDPQVLVANMVDNEVSDETKSIDEDEEEEVLTTLHMILLLSGN